MLYFNEYNIQNLPNNMERITYKFLLIVFIGGYVWTLTLGWYYSKETLTLKERICNVDENFKKLKSVIHYRDLYRRVTATGVLFAFSVVILCGFWLDLSFMGTNDLLRTFLVDDRQTNAKELHEYTIEPTRKRRRQFLGSSKVYLSEFCFQRLPIFPSNSASSLKHESQAVKQLHFLQEIRRVHLKLCKIAKMVNRVFDAQLMVQSSVVLVYLTVLLYFAYNEFGTSSTDVWQTINRLTTHIVELLNNIGKFTLASYSCENTVKQANKIREIINKLSIREFNTEMKDEIRQFSLQISLSQIGSSKSNFFRLNYGFLRGVS
ncbi:uncharacterized protein LOC143342050 [Colletes latitarsis]|uniref:uncharacterized protein LOC143342050 n=1 Tax=Colletes latitarsis TaxID=2605962 RepID=UPI004034FEC5